jgi:hypothetical protein
VQVTKGKPVDWVSGLPVTDERLQVTIRIHILFRTQIFNVKHIFTLMLMFQIIKNDDLEELQELGSGTFGTVYHGKWRGSDVAIKRINDRCFAGKPSEQEKMV